MNGLPALRVQRGYERAREIAAKHKIDAGVALDIAEAMAQELDRGTERVGVVCPRGCRRVVTDGVCPEHGDLNRGWRPEPAALVIAFPPITHYDSQALAQRRDEQRVTAERETP